MHVACIVVEKQDISGLQIVVEPNASHWRWVLCELKNARVVHKAYGIDNSVDAIEEQCRNHGGDLARWGLGAEKLVKVTSGQGKEQV